MAEVVDLGAVTNTIADTSSRLKVPENPYGIDRAPFVITTEENLTGKNALSTGNPYIFLSVNPTEVSFQQGIRGSEQKTRAGSVQHVWKDRNNRNSFFDEMVLGFQFQAGNTIPVIIDAAGNTEIAPGLENFYEMLELLDQERVTADGRPNYVYITYNSRNFPQITFTGFFEVQGFSFTDSAENPTGLSWSANFIVYNSYPKFNNAAELKRIFNLYDMR